MPRDTKNRSVPFSRTREQHSTETAEDYVEAVLETIESKGSCRVQDLAEHFDVSHVTVSRTVSRLQKEGFLQTEPYRPVELTAAGRRLAEKVIKRHEIVYQFLLTLGVDHTTAQIDSEGIEHHVSAKTLAAMKKFIANAK